MKLVSIVCLFVLFVSRTYGQATDPPRTTIDNSISGNNAEPELFGDVSLNYYNLVSANLQVSKDNDLQKVVLVPLKILSGSTYLPKKVQFLENTKLNLAQKNSLSTFGIGIGMDNSYPSSKRGLRLFEKITKDGSTGPHRVSDLEARGPQETASEYASRVSSHLKAIEDYKKAKQIFDAADSLKYIKYYKNLLKNSFKLTFGYNASFFSIIGGENIDLNKDGLIDNYYKRSGRDLSVSANYIFSECFAISAALRQQLSRATAVQNQNEVTYYGGSFGLAGRILVLNKNYARTKDYYKSLFVPQVILGGTIEYLKATNNELDAKDGITRATVFTPFLDFKISVSNQFRIGLPIKNYRAVSDKAVIGPFLQYTLTLAKQE